MVTYEVEIAAHQDSFSPRQGLEVISLLHVSCEGIVQVRAYASLLRIPIDKGCRLSNSTQPMSGLGHGTR